MPADLSEEELERALTGRLGKPLRVFEEIGSTNTEALEWSAAGAPEGALVTADHQTAGRGRWGRTWWSKPGTLLQFSLILRPTLPIDRLGLVTVAVGLACARAIEKLTGLETTIKWPNDVNIGGRKVAGILVETRVTGTRLEAAIVGVGLNFSWAPGDAPAEVAERATSIAAEANRLGREGLPGRVELLAEILVQLESIYFALDEAPSAEELLAEATRRSELIGRRVILTSLSGRSLEGVARRLLPNGALEIEGPDGPMAVQAADVELVRNI